MNIEFNHLVVIDEDTKKLIIYRVHEDGSKELFTSVDIPDISFEHDKDKFKSFSELLGENLLIDSPIARKLFKL